ncbi:VOC family protein [Niveibacterium sp. SC-1]|uniref:VOC family protein n=1 Tax=Niveibacterium sp. SC-1 TaxID=3135646 RepID=UPI00311D51B6
MTALSALGQIALQVTDADRSEAFYRDVLGLTRTARSGELVFFDCGQVRLMLQGGTRPRRPGNTLCLYFPVASLDKAVTDLQANGLDFEALPHRIGSFSDHELWMAFFRDPDGYLLALMEERR